MVAASHFGWVMRNMNGAFVPWDQPLASFVPAYKNRAPSDSSHVLMYAGQLPSPGLFQIFIGYRMQESSEVIDNLTSGSVTITAP